MAALTALVLAPVVAGCSPDSAESVHRLDDTLVATATAAPAGVVRRFERLGPLEPGTYAIDFRGYRFTLTLGSGWRLAFQSDAQLELQMPGTGSNGGDTFVRISDLHDAVVPADVNVGLWWAEPDNLAPRPDDLAAWFVALPYVSASPLEPVSVGELTGRRTEVVVGEIPTQPERPGANCAQDCLFWAMFDDDYRRAEPLRTGTEPAMIFADAPDGPFVVIANRMAPEADDAVAAASLVAAYGVLDSVEIRAIDS